MKNVHSRILSLLMALILLIGLCPVGAHAAEQLETIQETHINPLYADTVTEEDLKDSDDSNEPPLLYSQSEYRTTLEAVGADMREAMEYRSESITVYYQTTNLTYPSESFSDDVKAIMRDIFDAAVVHTGEPTEGDYLRWHYAGWKCSVKPELKGNMFLLTFTYTMTYYTTYEMEEVVTEKVDEVLESLDLDGKSDYNKILAVYDYICDNIEYDYDNLYNDSYKLKHSAYAALINKTAVCQGYALLLYRFALEMDIDCRLIAGTGNGGGHGWNIVKLGDLYYNLDSTWDAGVTNYRWFLKSPTNFTDHIRYEEYETAQFRAAYPMSVVDHDASEAQGTCGTDLYWILSDEGILNIFGTGTMNDYASMTDVPWSDFCDSIEYIVIGADVTGISENAFSNFSQIEDVYFGGTSVALEELGDAFPDTTRVHLGAEDPMTHWSEVGVAATCKSLAYTAEVCSCSTPYERNKVSSGNVNPNGHNFTGGVCSYCGFMNANIGIATYDAEGNACTEFLVGEPILVNATSDISDDKITFSAVGNAKILYTMNVSDAKMANIYEATAGDDVDSSKFLPAGTYVLTPESLPESQVVVTIKEPESKNSALVLEKNTITAGESIRYKATSYKDGAWIALYSGKKTLSSSESDFKDQAIFWFYVAGYNNAWYDYQIINPGEYTMILFKDSGYNPEVVVPITVTGGKQHILTTDKTEYAKGESIMVTIQNYSVGSLDWVALSYRGKVPNGSSVTSFYYYYPSKSGMTFDLLKGQPQHADKMQPGEYTVYFLANDSYDVIDSYDIVITEKKEVKRDVVDPTCEDDGYTLITYTDKSTEKINPTTKLGHAWGEYVYDGAEKKSHTRTCTRTGCGKTLTEDCNFDAGTPTKEPTDEENGIMTFTCEDCSGTYTQEISNKAVVSENIIKKATCDTPGKKLVTYEGGIQIEWPIQKLGHDYGEWVYDAANKKHTKTCANDIKGDNVVDHVLEEACSFTDTLKDGTITYTCDVCKGSYSEVAKLYADKKEYKFGEPINVTLNTEVEDETAWIGIYRKGETPGNGVHLSIYWYYVNETPATMNILETRDNNGRQFTAGEFTIYLFPDGENYTPLATYDVKVTAEVVSREEVKATCEDGGYLKITYSDGTEDYTTYPALTHRYSTKLVFVPTLRKHAYVCQNDESHIKDAADCTFGEGKVITAATADKPGVKEFTCSVCEGKYQEAYFDKEIKSEGVYKIATCTENGIYRFEYLDGTYLDVSIPALGHDYPTSWNSDSEKYQHIKICKNDSTHILKENCSYGAGVLNGSQVTYTCSVCSGTKVTGVLHTEKDVYELGEDIDVLAYCTTEGSWVGLYRRDEDPGDIVSMYYFYVTNSSSGINRSGVLQNMINPGYLNTERLDGLSAGDYSILLFMNESYSSCIAVKEITITESDVVSSFDFTVNGETVDNGRQLCFEHGEPMVVNATAEGFVGLSWVGIYSNHLNTDVEFSGITSDYWYYVKDHNGKDVNLSEIMEMEPANYTIVIFADGGYTKPMKYVTISPHSWVDATCSTPKTCGTCGAVDGDALPHDYVDEICTVCGKIEGLLYGIINDEAIITDYTGSRATLDLPSTIEGKPVTRIDAGAFGYCPELTYITIPNSVSTIGMSAFEGCSGLSGITLPNSITKIETFTFASCSSLTSITIPNNVSCIDDYAFLNCSRLADINIPNSDIKIYSAAFEKCNSLANVYYGGDLTTWESFGLSVPVDCRIHYSCTDPENHWSPTEKDATCTENGYIGEACVCGYLRITTTLSMGGHKDVAPKDHKCDTCGEPYGELHEAEEGSHDCGYCGKPVTNCEDKNPKDHKCDICGEPYGDPHEAAEGSHNCGYCGKSVSACADIDLNHKCDVCSTELSKCSDGDKNHMCDICTKELTGCVDEDHNEACDICGTEMEEDKPEEPTEPEMPEDNDVIRLAGANRLVTSYMVADQLKEVMGVEKFDAVIVASGATFADALPGSYLSAVKKAPILLTLNKDKYIAETQDYIRANLKIGGTVYILGGTSAVSAKMEQGLDGFKVQRVAGNDRFGTNLEILKVAGVKSGEEILVCTAKEYADSLSASATGKPILLVYKKLTDAQKEYLASLDENRFCIVGGIAAVPGVLADEIGQFGNVNRLAGEDRLETSTMVAEKYFKKATAAVVAYGWDFPDGLCGGSLAYAMKAPLILTHSKSRLYTYTAGYMTQAGLTEGFVLGGDGLVSDAATKAIFGMVADNHITVQK